MTVAQGARFYRMILPHEQLACNGWEVSWASRDPATGPGLTTKAMTGHDVIVGQRIDRPGGVHVWRESRTATSRLVFELDDDIFHITPENFTAYTKWKDPARLDTAIHAIEVSDLVTVSTPTLGEVLAEHNPNVVVLPNHIPAFVCDLERVRRDRPCVGWMGGASHGLDVGMIVQPVRKFLSRFPGWDLRLAATDYRPTFRLGDRASFSRWVQVNDDPEGFYRSMDFDIGLAPVTPTTFNASKSHLKALEYAALGIPVIASDFPPYRDFVRHGETGFLVKRDHEWVKYMSELAGDDDLREAMGIKARELARQHTIEEGWALWDKAYRGLFR